MLSELFKLGSTGLFLLAISFLASGCNSLSSPTPSPPSLHIEDDKRLSGQLKATPWWREWQDKLLETLVERTLAGNTDLRVAIAKLDELQAFQLIAESKRHPTIGVGAASGLLSGETQLERFRHHARNSSYLDGYLGGVSGELEPDLFGILADEANAASAMVKNAEEQLNGAQMLVVYEVVKNYIEIIGLQLSLQNLEKSLAALRQLLDYGERRFLAGQALRTDVLASQEKLQIYLAKKPDLIYMINSRQHRIGALIGVEPNSLKIESHTSGIFIPRLPTRPLPSDLMERRPDLKASAAAVNAQTYRLSAATKEFLPRFKIDLLGGRGGLQFSGLPGVHSIGGILGLSVYLPIFTAGRIQANIDANDAELAAAIAEYDRTLLLALEQMHNAYDNRKRADAQISRLSSSVRNAEEKCKMEQMLFETGRKTLDDVITAKIDVIEQKNELIKAQVDSSVATALLFTAVGGDW